MQTKRHGARPVIKVSRDLFGAGCGGGSGTAKGSYDVAKGSYDVAKGSYDSGAAQGSYDNDVAKGGYDNSGSA